MRTTYGDEYGLVVETAPGAGTKVTVRVPKFAPGVHRVTSARDAAALRVLVVDDERPALDELQFLLEQDVRVGEVVAATPPPRHCARCTSARSTPSSSTSRCPASPGSSWPQVLERFQAPPPVVFVTAHEAHAVDAFDLHAVDYVLKPVREERLAEAVRRVIEGGDRDPRRPTRCRSPSSSAA